MNVKNLGEIEAVAFDIDGTLYAPWRLTVRAIFRYARHCFFFLKYGLVRLEMHKMPPQQDFRRTQAQRMALRMKCSEQKAEDELNRIVYHGMEKYFPKISCFKGVPETFRKFKEAGLKIALLSDLPPEQKCEIWGIKPYCDAILGTESLGALKPDSHSFLKMAQILGVEPSKILYVGNSIKYDVKGSKNAGMKCAYIRSFWRKVFNKSIKDADICFSNYRQLQEFVLE